MNWHGASGVAEALYFCDQMRIFYDGLILFLRLAVRIGALFNPKLKAFVRGRADVFDALHKGLNERPGHYIWVHCASLGEFEQGRPVIESLKKNLPEFRILLTFFSPSGYEVRKDYQYADVVLYLPWDTSANARAWLSAVKPVMAIFVKYEFWHHYIAAMKAQRIPVLSISAIFRPQQVYFRWYGDFYRSILKNITHFFVQNEVSLSLLKSIGVEQVTLGGDTRFDRVHEIVRLAPAVPLAEAFSRDVKVLVAGSIWPDDFRVLLPLINERKLRFIIAPHEISERFITSIESGLRVPHERYSRAEQATVSSLQVLIIDNVGMLSSLYAYGDLAFVGGGFREGLHNILEAACYGLPVLFGNRAYNVYQEANDLISMKAAFAVADSHELRKTVEFLEQPHHYTHASQASGDYVRQHTGATEKIIAYCKSTLE